MASGPSEAIILLVEDNPDDVRLLKEVCDEMGFDGLLSIVSTGSGALDVVNRRGEHTAVPRPHLIVLNWHLQDTDGKEVLAQSNEDSVHGRIPVIVTSGHCPNPLSRKCTNRERMPVFKNRQGPTNSRKQFVWSSRSGCRLRSFRPLLRSDSCLKQWSSRFPSSIRVQRGNDR